MSHYTFYLILHFFFPDDRSKIKYSIYSGDPVGQFKIDAVSGTIRTVSALDHETRAQVLLNVQATSGEPPVYGHTQVSIVSKSNGVAMGSLTLGVSYLH